MMAQNYFKFQKIYFLTPVIQIILMCLSFITIAIIGNISYQNTGLIFGYQPYAYWGILFAPIYEEVIFRGVIFPALLKKVSTKQAVIYTSALFGLWHLKNIFFLNPIALLTQIIYAAFIIGPLLSYLTYRTKTIWIGSLVHFANNLIAFILIFSNQEFGINTILRIFR